MSGAIKIKISETVEELKELLKSTKNQEIQPRVQALYWLKSEQVTTTEARAKLIGKHRVTVSRWLSSYRTGGISALLAKGKSSGRNRKLNSLVEESLKQELKDTEGFSSYKEVQTWLKAVAVKTKTLSSNDLLGYRMGLYFRCSICSKHLSISY